MSGVFLAAGGLTATAQEIAAAQELAVADSVSVQQTITVTGSRGKPRTVADSAVPIDVLDEATIKDVSFTDTNDVLKTLVPSYTIGREPISDGSTFVRPAALRGLSSDKTLVLVNSKRRHRAALVSIGGSGTQGPDVATIPASALKTVEILRDGAAAQYGSDAIAGVINFILKDSAEGAEITVQGGQYYEGDGEDLLIAGNIGLPLGENGFINISLEGTSAQPTSRGKQWDETTSFDVDAYVAANPDKAYLYGPGGDYDSSNVQIWGQPESEAFRSFVNMGYTLPGGQELYAFANYSNSSADGDFNYRFPGNSVNGPLIRLQDGSTYKFDSLFPAGFTPRFFGNVVDYSTTGGIRGEFTPDFTYDFSARYGKNQINYKLGNTVNPSLGDSSPTVFHPGDLISDEVAVAADFVYSYEMGSFASPVDFSFGAEWRDEGYEAVAGDEASYIAGPYAFADPWDFCEGAAPTVAGLGVIADGSSLDCADPSDPVYTLNGVGSNGFPGYSPDYSGSLNRDSYGIYAGAAADLTDALFVEVAGRFENYSDFGETTNGKIAARWSVTPNVNIRGSVGTGFRAPTPGQLATTNVSTRFPAGEPVASGLFPASNPVSQFLGAEELKPEKSTNYSLGATGTFGPLSVTLDLYKIDISDQFYASRSITVTPEIRDQLIAAGVPGADTIGAVQFFQNAFDSSTEGVDLVMTYLADWGTAGSTAFTLSSNYNTFSVEKVNIDGLFLEEDVYDFENGTPNYRTTFTVSHTIGAYTFLGRANYFGEYNPSQCFTGAGADGYTCPESAAYPTGLVTEDSGSEILFDIEASYAYDDTTKFTVGARNVTNEYPYEPDYNTLKETGNGRIYRSDSIVDWQGGFIYLKATKSF
ncbi:MAG: TonB-dependent receptor [Hyphomonas oceanitis]|uniref:TonB-dependent receptor plug domain-containing protein n=1 Tax=Hyphomonas oceanitis TaxID=81033 RepID=UPI0030038A0F